MVNAAKKHLVCVATKKHRRQKTNNGGMAATKSKYSGFKTHLNGCTSHGLTADTKLVTQWQERFRVWNKIQRNGAGRLKNLYKELLINEKRLKSQSGKLIERNNQYHKQQQKMPAKPLNFNINTPLLSNAFKLKHNLPLLDVKKENKRNSNKLENDIDEIDEETEDDDDEDDDVIILNKKKDPIKSKNNQLNQPGLDYVHDLDDQTDSPYIPNDYYQSQQQHRTSAIQTRKRKKKKSKTVSS